MTVVEFSPASLHEKIESALIDALGRADVPLAVAFSGGPDSTALLHALVQSPARKRLRALHVNHQLQPDAGAWAQACALLCEDLGVVLEVIVVAATATHGESPEEAARNARYRALGRGLGTGECLVTAHHADDQVETLCLQLLRGAGLPGLAAMPVWRELGRGILLRPLLDWSRATLLDYVKQTGCPFAIDPHNSDDRYDRAYLRKSVLPRLRSRWPGFVPSVNRSASHIADAQSLLTDLGRADLRYVGDDAGRLRIDKLVELSRPRQRNLLRTWIGATGRRAPAARQLEAFLNACTSPRTDSAAVLDYDDGALRRFGSALYLTDFLDELPEVRERLTAEVPVALPTALGRLRVCAGEGDQPGIRVPATGFNIRFRTGGERLRLSGRAGSRSLKSLLREGGIVPWMRNRLPLLYDGQELAAVADLWTHSDYCVRGGPRVVWEQHPPLK